MHEVFLCRLANHPIFRSDHNFRVFLEYEQDVSCLKVKTSDVHSIAILYVCPAVSPWEKQEGTAGNNLPGFLQDHR